jgi:hypothetical protein
MTIILRTEYTVTDFDSWKKLFDSDPIGRQKSGVRRYCILRPTDDPNYVMIDAEFDGLKQAEDYRSSLRNLYDSAGAQRIVQNPKHKILEQTETREY